MPEVASSAPPHAVQGERKFTLRERILLWLIAAAGTLVIRILCSTVRFSTSFEDGSPGKLDPRPVITSLWHNCIISATYLCRDQNIGVMSSDSFDGEYTGRIIRKFGFVKVRGSSSRGAVRALLGMRSHLQQGWSVSFTLDGPRGPRYMAKPGPVLLARKTGIPMIAFHIALERAWVLKTWDGCMVPKPFTRALFRMSRTIPVPPDGDDEVYLKELQSALDRVRVFAEENVGKQTPA